MRKITFSKHARFQLKERNIPEQEVKDSFERSDKVIKQAPGRFRLIKVIQRFNKEYLLVVVFERKEFSNEVITVFITSKIKKYL